MRIPSKRICILTVLLVWSAFTLNAMSATCADFFELMSRKTPDNGPIQTPVTYWSILAPGTGGTGAPTCSMCADQMPLYDAAVFRQAPLSSETLGAYFKRGEVGLYGESTYRKKPRTYYPFDDFADLIESFQARGYDSPIVYEPPRTLHARIDWDEHHVPHIVGETVEDVSYGLGYATVYTNMFEMLLLRFLGMNGILQTGVNLQSLYSGDLNLLFEQVMQFRPINYTRDELMDTMDPVLCDGYLGEDCQEMASAMVAYQEGIDQAMMARYPVFHLFDQLGIAWPEWEAIDSAAIALAITGVFGDPGADQLANLSLYQEIAAVSGEENAQALFDDFKLRNAPLNETTVTVKKAFPNPVYADGSDAGDPFRFVDEDSIARVDLEDGENHAAMREPEKPSASNWLVISKTRSASGRPLFVGGPQMHYFRPNIFLEFDARTVDREFQISGVTLPGLFIVAFSGNAHNGVWSPTAALGKTSDIVVEKLCSPDGGAPVDPQSPFYWHDGACKPMQMRESGTPFTVHGPVTGWGTVDGQPVALVEQSYNTAHIAQGVIPYYALAKGRIRTAREFVDMMHIESLALNYAYINESEIAYINTGLYPVRAAGAQIDFPTWGTGEWDWQGVISLDRRPHAIDPEAGYMLSWNNQAAPGFYDGDGDFQRVQTLYRLIQKASWLDLPALAEIALTAGVQDGYALTFVPLLLDYTRDLPAVQEAGLAEMLAELAAWEEAGAKRLDLDRDGILDDAGPAIMDEIMACLKAELEERLHLDLGHLDMSGYQDWAATRMVMLLKRARANGDDPLAVDERLLQCGDGTFGGCRDLVAEALWQARHHLAEHFGTDVPARWLKPAGKIQAIPADLLEGKTWHWQNRPTYQQVATVY